MKVNIIGTGSTGNCIIFDDNIMIDIGLSFKNINDHIANVSIVLLTHEHGDHLNKTTARKLFTFNENIKFCGHDRMCKILYDIGIPIENILKIDAGKLYKKDEIIFSPVSLYHDVANFGYRIINGNYKHFHATDTFHLDGIKAIDYDSATLEANHCLDSALEIIENSKNNNEFSHMQRAIKTHLSVDKSIKFIKDNNIKKFIPIHIGNKTIDSVKSKINNELPSVVNWE